jgi:pimeloyl-ACP methyl ester carboxylesterase
VHYADFGGEGPLVVCVHGLGGSYANWVGLAPLLARRARVLAVDLAGHGRTPAAGRRTDVRANQRLLDRFLTEVAGRPTVLVGNSMGGMISVMQASAAPDTVAGLVLLNPALPRPRGVRQDPEIARLFAGVMLPWLGEFMLARRRARYTPEEMVADTMRRCTADPVRVPADLLTAQADVIRERSLQPDIDKAFVAAARSVVYALLARPAQLAGMVSTVRQPTLLVHGAADRLVPVGVARHLAAQRPDWRVEILDGFGHLPQLEDATTTAKIISDWFSLDGREALRSASDFALPPIRPKRSSPARR